MEKPPRDFEIENRDGFPGIAAIRVARQRRSATIIPQEFSLSTGFRGVLAALGIATLADFYAIGLYENCFTGGKLFHTVRRTGERVMMSDIFQTRNGDSLCEAKSFPSARQ
jgi:hypothetical protein